MVRGEERGHPPPTPQHTTHTVPQTKQRTMATTTTTKAYAYTTEEDKLVFLKARLEELQAQMQDTVKMEDERSACYQYGLTTRSDARKLQEEIQKVKKAIATREEEKKKKTIRPVTQ